MAVYASANIRHVCTLTLPQILGFRRLRILVFLVTLDLILQLIRHWHLYAKLYFSLILRMALLQKLT